MASKNGDLKKVSSLQKLMLRSRANWLQAIRRVTQINKGRRTPGVDREVVTSPEERLELFYWLETIKINEWNPPPVQRVTIPKGKRKVRRLGIPVVRDRVFQAIVKNALEPFWEARFEGISYGFRPGRSTHDAIEEIFLSVQSQKKQWMLDADIKGAFDNLNHDHLMKTISNFPARALIKKWLKAGVMVGLDLSPTPTGAPQGGIISPLLMNIALHGMEEAIGVKRIMKAGYPLTISPVKVIRYADDLVAVAVTKEDAERAKQKLAEWLAPRGLEMSAEKTNIVHIDQGFDFLGFNIRRYKSVRKKRGTVIHIKPSEKSIERFKDKVRHIFQRGKSKTPEQILWELNPLITGWGLYFRTGVSKVTFSKLDNFIWHKCWRYARRRHPNKNRNWVMKKYFTTRNGRQWTFYDEDTGLTRRYLMKIPIERHRKVKSDASPDDPTLVEYWTKRRTNPRVPTGRKYDLWKRQKGLCPQCESNLDNGEELHVHHLRGRNEYRLKYLQLLHETCHHQITFGTA